MSQSQTGVFSFAKVPSTAAAQAYAFHLSVAKSDSHIWPRKLAEIQQFAENGQLFGVRREGLGQFVALCYVALDSDGAEFEVGGLTVAQEFQKLGIGRLLVRFALAHTIAYERPWHHGQQIITYVHEANDAPRKILEQLGFQFLRKFEAPMAVAPASMKRNAAGKVIGDKFEFTHEGLKKLSVWINKEFTGKLADGSNVKFDLGPATVSDLQQALDDLAKQISDH